MLRSSAHLIVTMRSKTAWVTEEYQDRQGRTKTRPKRIGMAPVQRPGTEYEFSSLLNLETDTNFASVLKDRTEVFASLNETPQRLSEQWGERLAAWLHEGVVPAVVESTATPMQRASAVVQVWEAAFTKSATLPDLARDFESAQRELRGFGDTLGGYNKKTLLDRLTAAKDKQKLVLAPAPSGAATGGVGDMPLDHLEVTLLEDLLLGAGIPVAQFVDAFGVVRIAQLPAAKLDEARAWIFANSAEGRAA